ncbi:MAG TPA: FKBP-type peptidyl-prolyl cis-trans isomerase [Bacteroidales bacterium]|nr:FKBP-type peptidyl-prolyl cis-trans isomerase [Bacteroidales bacterium]
MTLKVLTIISLFLFFLSCRERTDKATSAYRPDKDDMVDVNRYIIQKDRERIQSYFERKGLTMTETSTGLWYCITKYGEGESFKENDRIIYNYQCHLLDGTLCYSSKDKGPNDIRLGRSELPAGLNEGMKLLRPGSEAIFILPPFLAYGLIGDGKKIPPRSPLVYNIQVIR